MNVPLHIIEKVFQYIIATAKHEAGEEIDTDLEHFLDLDLAVLGQPWNKYANYVKNVRKEYSIYPNIIYKPGRRKVLNHFLEEAQIFKTEEFALKYEVQARKNILKEIEEL